MGMERNCCVARTAGVVVLSSLLLAAWPVRGELVFLQARLHADSGETRRIVEQLEDDWQAAIKAGNTQQMGAMLAESYIGIGPDGTLETKAEEISARSSGEERFDRLDVVDRRIRAYGTTAVVTSKVKVQGEYAGQPILGEYRYTRVWSLQHGQWRIVSFEASRIHDSSERGH